MLARRQTAPAGNDQSLPSGCRAGGRHIVQELPAELKPGIYHRDGRRGVGHR